MVERFWAKVKKNPSTGCLEWQGAIQTRGYGSFKCDGVAQLAHRIAWRLEHGEISDDLLILHSCDNRRCVNTEHHSLGTHIENMADMWAKGRHHTQQPQRLRLDAGAIYPGD